MMKKFIALVSLLLCVCLFGCSAGGKNVVRVAEKANVSSEQTAADEQEKREVPVTKAEREYAAMIQDPSKVPISFIYDDVYFHGFSPLHFTQIDFVRTDSARKVAVDMTFDFYGQLEITVKTAYYVDYEAYDYTVYFKNVSDADSGVLREVKAADMEIAGKNAVLKGIMGDYDYYYESYAHDLTENKVNFTSTRGRATHTCFPYFNLEHDGGGSFLALGWSGTWSADFVYDGEQEATRFRGANVVGMRTYLKPNETVRTALVAKLDYYERDEERAMNLWRKWMVDCNMPRNGVDSELPVQPFTTVGLMSDTGRPNSDGSDAEGYDTWKRSLDLFLDHGLTADFRWMDAGWYVSPAGNSTNGDWYGTVGTWDFDPNKWPNDTFRESTDYSHEHGIGTLLWFEPDRVTHIDELVQNYGYKYEWAISDLGDGNYHNNLGDPDCLEWTLGRILNTMEKQGIDLYREDFNMDPGFTWQAADGYQGPNRVGITENKYMQGHYALFDRIIDYCGKNGKCTFVDSCASGGGRNDLETMRRAVPLLRSDNDRSYVQRRLAITTRVARWLPFTGALSYDENGNFDVYSERASFLPHIIFGGRFSTMSDETWNVFRQAYDEWTDIQRYFYKDYYVLTPMRSIWETAEWTAWEYFDPETDSGVIQAFRAQTCNTSRYTVQVRGVDPDRYYRVRDLDHVNSAFRVKGSDLINGFTLQANKARTAITAYIEPYEAY